jgi:hypothetical protein
MMGADGGMEEIEAEVPRTSLHGRRGGSQKYLYTATYFMNKRIKYKYIDNISTPLLKMGLQ